MGAIKSFMLIFSLAVSPFVWPQYTDIGSVVAESNGILYWNPRLESGFIESGGAAVVFKLRSPWMLFDWAEKYPTDDWVRGPDGGLMVPERARTALLDFFARRKAERAVSPKIQAIVIDPGHGGKDPGAHYTYKINGKKKELFEKDITLEIGRNLDKLLSEAYTDKFVILTRKSDEYKKLEERVSIANTMKTAKYGAVIYVSIHVNAAFNKKAKGFQVWYLPNDYRRSVIDEKNVTLDEKEIIPILNTMLEEEYTVESITLAKRILSGLESTIGGESRNLGLKAESWFVVRNTKMPSVLIETGFLSNEEEALLLDNGDYLKKLAQGIYNGISSFILEFEHTRGFTE